MQQYNFSIIIPHKNIPDLLQRCLDSIPERDDVQIIIVDDNSDPGKVDFSNFPGLSKPNTEVYFDKSNKGAGRARNIGLEHAKGEWVLFADADDFFVGNFDMFLSKNLYSDYDIIYFNPTSKNNNFGQAETGRAAYFQSIMSQDIDSILFYYITPWGKLINRRYLIENNIKFEEIRWSNDVMFGIKVAYNTCKIKILFDYLYFLTDREGSLANSSYNISELDCRTNQDISAYLYVLKMKCHPGLLAIKGRFLSIISHKEFWLFVKYIGKISNDDRGALLRNLTCGHSILFVIWYYFLTFLGVLISYFN